MTTFEQAIDASRRLTELLDKPVGTLKGETKMPDIGARKIASGVIGSIQTAVGGAMDEMRLEVAAGINELLTEIRDGGKSVRRALQDEAAGVREELSGIVGNAQAAAEDAIKIAADNAQAASDAKRAAEAKANGHDDAAQQGAG